MIRSLCIFIVQRVRLNMYVGLMEEGNVYRVLVRKPKEGDHLEDIDIDYPVALQPYRALADRTAAAGQRS